MRIVLAANAEADQPWVADATAQLAKQTGGSVAVVSVDELEVGAQAAFPRAAYVELAEKAAAAAVRRLAEHGVEASKAVLSGGATERILDFAEEQQADLIVLGASTRGALTQRILGSVPLAVVQRSKRPVMIVTQPVP